MTKVELNVVTRGSVSGGVKNEVVNTVKDCFKNFGSHVPYRLEILLTDSEAILKDYLRQEKFNQGIIEEEPLDEVCRYEKLSQFNKQARQGIIRHQAAHSALHGSLEFRIFKIPEESRQIAMVKNIDNLTLENAIHKLSLAIKDFEATRLLAEHNYVNCQLAFALEWIQPAMKIGPQQRPIRVDRQEKFLNQIALLKPILFSQPLMQLPKSKKIGLEMQVMLGRRIEEIVEELPENDQARLLQVSSRIAEGISVDTHDNVDNALRHAISLA